MPRSVGVVPSGERLRREGLVWLVGGSGVFASCHVRCTAPSIAFAELPLMRLYRAPGRGFLMKVALYQVSTLYPFYYSYHGNMS